MSNSQPSLRIIEPNAHGHRMNYVRIVAKEAIRQKIAVTIATFPQSLAHSSYKVIAQELAGQYREQIIAIPPKMEASLFGQSELRRHLAYHALFRQLLSDIPKSEQPDVVFVPNLNICDKAIAVLGSPFGSSAWSGLVMRDTFHHKAMGVLSPVGKSDKIKERIFRRLLAARHLAALFSIDEVIAGYVQKACPEQAGKLYYAADPVEIRGTATKEEARKRFGLSSNVPVLLVYGAITERKGIAELLEATQNPAFPSDVHLVMAGEQAGEAKRILSSPPGIKLKAQNRLTEVTGYLDDASEYAIFHASDVVWVGYRQHYGSSGVILQASAMGLPVLSCEEGLLGWRTKTHRIGLSVDVTNTQQTAEAVRRLFYDENLRAECRTHGLRLAQQHTPQNFAQTILSGVFGTQIADNSLR